MSKLQSKENNKEKVQKKTNKPVTERENSGIEKRSKRKQKISNYQRAKQVYEQILEDRKKAKEEKDASRKAREEALAVSKKSKKKTNQAHKKQNRKGQPNLGAQVEVILQKIEKKISKNEL